MRWQEPEPLKESSLCCLKLNTIWSYYGDRKMVSLSSSSVCLPPILHRNLLTSNHITEHCKLNHINISLLGNQETKHRKLKHRAKAVNDVVSVMTTTDPSEARVTWEIVAGTLAGVVPFVVAGIEFSKRIVAQRECSVCKGSGLVLRDNKYYFRCPRCGGFLPWQSWRRFFSG